MFCEFGYNIIKTCQRSRILRRVSLHEKRNQSVLPRSIFISATNRTVKKLTASQIWRRQNEFVLQSAEKFQDTFGTIEDVELQYERVKDDPEDVEEYKRIKSGQGKTVAQYIKEIKNHLENNDYKKALDVLEIDMVNDSKPPIVYIYKLLISYNGKQGNVKEAYRLYTNLKKRNKDLISGAIYTSLFNACANCTNSSLALEKAAAIREYLMNDKNHKVNTSNYNAMLKAFGRQGDLNTCFEIVDEVFEQRDKVRIDTYCFLLQACVSDPNSGLRHAISVWRKMLQYRVKPTVIEFNIMLRCVRDCAFGDVDLLNNLIKQIKIESSKFFRTKVKISMKDGVKERMVLKIPVPKNEAFKSLLVNQNSEENVKENSQSNLVNLSTSGTDVVNVNNQHCKNLPQLEIDINESESNLEETEKLQDENDVYLSESQVELKTNHGVSLPNLLSITPSMGSALNFNSMTKPHERFLCFGGLKGFLKTMSEFGAIPNVKTFTLLLDLAINSNNQEALKAEQVIMSEVKAHNVKLDTQFFNVLMKRRIDRNCSSLIQDTLKEMQLADISPDLVTFGVLATGCSTHESGLQLIEKAQNIGIRLNSEILGALLSQASRTMDFKYIKTILKAAKENDTKLSPKFFALLHRVINKQRMINQSKTENSETLLSN